MLTRSCDKCKAIIRPGTDWYKVTSSEALNPRCQFWELCPECFKAVLDLIENRASDNDGWFYPMSQCHDCRNCCDISEDITGRDKIRCKAGGPDNCQFEGADE